jgi:hypothetical protein
MVDTTINPYGADSPLGAALKNLSGVLTKKSSEASDVAHLEYALKQKQTRENTAALGDMLRKMGTDNFDRRAAIDMATRAGVTPEHLGGYERYNSANQYGAGDQRTTNAFVGAGGSYSSTAGGVRENIAAENARAAATLTENQRQFDSKPTTIGTPQGPLIVRQNDAYGQPAVEDLGKVKGNAARVALNSPGGLGGADDATKQFIGVEGKGQQTPHNYVVNGQNFITYDGTTDANTGKALPGGGYLANAQGPAKDVGLNTAVTTNLQEQDINNQKFRSLLGYTKKLAQADPNNFGVTGAVKGFFQDTTAAADNIARGLGYNGLQEGLQKARERAMANGVDPGVISGVFDARLPQLHSAADLAVYSAAEALAGQSGRSVSNNDVKIIRNIVGDPREWSSNQQKYLSKLDTVGASPGSQPGGHRPNSCGAAIPRCAAGRARGFATPPSSPDSGRAAGSTCTGHCSTSSTAGLADRVGP